MAANPTYTISGSVLHEGRYEVYRDSRYIGLIRATGMGQFAAEPFTQGQVGTAPTIGGALDLIIERTSANV